ncbi:hypothetical protein VTL71DRAFT_13795 [Oculimacula yallundae]|uniref:Polyketide cyclase/dehydrase n=1 Tax=Oculimacula yallundae TaxID=86028 RepID=A0ABR4CLY9_9HELO
MSAPKAAASSGSILPAPLPTPTHSTGLSWTVHVKTFIPSVSPDDVLGVIRDTSTWEKWNGFTPFFELSPSSSPATSTAATSPDQLPHPGSEAGLSTEKEGWLNLGSRGTMSVFMSGNGLAPGSKEIKSRKQVIVVSVLEPLSSSPSASSSSSKGYRIAWIAEGYAHWQLHSERVTELTETTDEEGRTGTEYLCWESFGGLLAPVVRLAVGGQLKERFGDYANGLREFCVDGKGKTGGE